MGRPRNTDPRRAEIAMAAWRVIAREGLAGATMRAIAAEAGCTTGSLTHQFRDRQHLLGHALGLAIEDSTARVVAALGRGSLSDAIAELLPLDEHRRLEGAVWLTHLAASQHDPALAAALIRRTGASATALREAFAAELTARGRPLTGSALDDLVDEIVSAVDGIAVYALADPQRYPPERQLALAARILARVGLAD
jgi:AcrR family transcriptional regulator